MRYKIENDSGDKKYFTIIPNYILNHSTLWDREVYIQMKRITGENGTCWTSQKTLSNQCGISINRLKKSIKYLVEHSWIKEIGKKKVNTQGGIQEVMEYRIADLWKLNIEYYKKEGVSPDDTPSPKGVSRDTQRGITDEDKGVSPDDDKEEPLLNNNQYNNNQEYSEQSSQDIPLIIKSFELINPACKKFYGNKTQRKACEDLIENYTMERVLNTIEKVLPATQGLKFFPTITTPLQLFEKWSSLEGAIARYQQDNNKPKWL